MDWDRGYGLERSGFMVRHWRHDLGEWGLGGWPLVILAVLIAIAITATLLMLPEGFRRFDERRRRLARENIFEEINAALKEAKNESDSDKQVVAIKKLIETYDKRLGALSAFAKDIGGPFETLRKAVEPRKKKKDSPPAESAHPPTVKLGETPWADINISSRSAHESEAEVTPKSEEVARTIEDRDKEVRDALDAFAVAWKEEKIHSLLSDVQDALLKIGPKRRDD